MSGSEGIVVANAARRDRDPYCAHFGGILKDL